MTSEATGTDLGETVARVRRDPAVQRVLVFGSSGCRDDGACIVEVAPDEAPTVQLEARYDLGVITADAWLPSSAERRRALVHNLVAHLSRGARAVIDGSAADEAETLAHARACGLEPSPDGAVRAFRRVDRTTVHDLVADARARLTRLAPDELAALIRRDDSCLILDTRCCSDRLRFGTIPGSRQVQRTTLEWRVDPASGYSDEGVHDLGRHVVVVCNDGYSSSLAAASLQQLGLGRATDLRGGFRAWLAAGLPVVVPQAGRTGRTCGPSDASCLPARAE